jgi:hypothetical protein
MPVSNKIIPHTIKKGKNDTTIKIKLFEKSFKINEVIMFSRVWPDIILAKSRIDKLNALDTYETTSIKINKGAKSLGAPGGRKRVKNCKPCLRKPIIVIAIVTDKPKLKVCNMWLVMVKLNGTNPIKLDATINKKRVNVKIK